MTTASFLELPNFLVPFQVETNASVVGIRAALGLQKRPIAFYSQKLSPHMQAASTYYKEMFAITQAVKKWRHYLFGHRFTILTD